VPALRPLLPARLTPAAASTSVLRDCNSERQRCALTCCINRGMSCCLQFKRQLLKEEAALRIYDKATDGEAIAGTASSPTSCMQHA
jgi:hypothetical protein